MVNNENVKNNASNRQQQNCGQLKKKSSLGHLYILNYQTKK